MVDENRFEGAARTMGGKVREVFANLTGDAGAQARDRTEQVYGQAQDTMGSAMDAADGWRKTIVGFTRDKPLLALLAAVSAGFVLRSMAQKPRR